MVQDEPALCLVLLAQLKENVSSLIYSMWERTAVMPMDAKDNKALCIGRKDPNAEC